MTEFDVIHHFFNLKAFQRSDVALGMGDDAALLVPPTHKLLAYSMDSQVEGVHFDEHTTPKNLGYKSLAVSLSDMAAMGAEPAWVMLAITLPSVNQQWLEDFSAGFFELVEAYHLQLIGGNTTSGSLSVTTHMTGFLPIGGGVRRSGAKPGDFIYVTGTLGDAGLALHFLKTQNTVPDYFLSRLQRPTPRIQEGLLLQSLATSMIDVSDGLIADLGHILEKSNVGAKIQVEHVPLSDEMKQEDISSAFAYELALSAGDDYELCFTVSSSDREKVNQLLPHCTCIGTINESKQLLLTYENQPFHLKKQGYQHFE